MKNSELRSLLKRQGLTTTGKKQQLIDRLKLANNSSNAKQETLYDGIESAKSSSPKISITQDSYGSYRPRFDSYNFYRDNADLYSTGEIGVGSECDENYLENGGSYFPQKLMEKFDEIVKVTLSLQSQLTEYEKKMSQLELKNAQLENMMSELIKGSLDYEHERSNVVVYGLNKSVVDTHVDDKQAVNKFAIDFVRKYLPNYEASDVTARVVQSNNQDSSVMISLACSADAFKLTKRCRKKGFTKVRQGLTKPERMISKSVTLKTTQLNSKLSKTSDKIYVKRHSHSIAKVMKDDPRKPLVLFSPEYNLTNLNGTATFKLTNLIRNETPFYQQAPLSEQQPQSDQIQKP